MSISATALLHRRRVLGTALACGLALTLAAQGRHLLRISSPAVPDDGYARMCTVLEDPLDRYAPSLFGVQINLKAAGKWH